MAINNGMILTGWMNNSERRYFIRQYRYDEKSKEILLYIEIKKPILDF